MRDPVDIDLDRELARLDRNERLQDRIDSWKAEHYEMCFFCGEFIEYGQRGAIITNRPSGNSVYAHMSCYEDDWDDYVEDQRIPDFEDE